MQLSPQQKEILKAWPKGVLTSNGFRYLPTNGARTLNEIANIIERLEAKGLCRRVGTRSALQSGRLFQDAELTPTGEAEHQRLNGEIRA